MKIKCMGAARTVTGSCFVIETGKSRFAIDCGMHQGSAEIEKRNWDLSAYRPEEIDFFLMTHAHIDHSGLLPRMVRERFRGRIYATPPTRDLLEIMLLDSAHIQEMEAQWKSRKRLRFGGNRVEPLYTTEDAVGTLPLFEVVGYRIPFDPAPGIRVVFQDAGHILGSSLLEVWIEEEGVRRKIVFSGDIGRSSQLMVEDPSIVEKADVLFLESTYGNRDHKDETQSLNELAEAISYSYGRGEKVVIPAFAVERTQEIIYSLYLLSKQGRLPADMPVFVDSPLATKATEIFRNHPDYFDRETRKLLAAGEDPLSLPQLRFTTSTQESMAINELRGPAVVISASGMADAGRIKHHLRHNLWREGASIVFVGFQAQGTTGRKIVDGAKVIRIFNEDIAVKAKVYTINGFSAHAGRSQILEWVSAFRSPGMQVFLVHGEYSAQESLAAELRERFGFSVEIPDYLEEWTLGDGRVEGRATAPKKPDRFDWDRTLAAVEEQLAYLRSQRRQLDSGTTAEKSLRLQRIAEAKRILGDILRKVSP